MKEKTTRPCWDKYFLDLCVAISVRSLDIDTKLGCVIVNSRNRIVSTGYNSLPAGVCDDNWPLDRESKLYLIQNNKGEELLLDMVPENCEGSTFSIIDTVTKYDVITHAELNAIAAAAADGIQTRGCKLYCTYLPCSECAKAVIAAGITAVIYEKENPRFKKSHAVARELFTEAKVEFKHFNREE